MSESDIIRIAQEVSQETAEQFMRAFGAAPFMSPAIPGPITRSAAPSVTRTR